MFPSSNGSLNDCFLLTPRTDKTVTQTHVLEINIKKYTKHTYKTIKQTCVQQIHINKSTHVCTTDKHTQ